MNFFGLHLRAYAITEFFDAFAVISACDIFDEGFDSSFRFFAGIDVFITPYAVGTVIGIFQCRCYAIDRNGINRVVIEQIRQSDIADSAGVLSDTLDEDTGVIRFQGFVICFFSPVDCLLFEQGTRTGRLRASNQDDRHIFAADIFPVGDFRREYVL